ncbi:WD40 repeat-like protein [Lipomyces oligophaga]|uniref:WD40 repeat-like protein n=1 Tax=Lipomyces oligophaga TaxID=45792 RepID=UPI0034CF2413
MSAPAAVATLRAHNSSICVIAFHSSNLRLVSGDENGWCIHWSLVTRRPIAIWKSHEASILSLLWLSEDLLLTHGRDNKLHVFRLDSQTLDVTIPKVSDNAPSRSSNWRKPWLVVSIEVNALNFCGAACQDENTIAVPGTLDSDTIDIYNLLPNLTRPFKAIKASEKTGIVMALAFDNNYLIAGYESGHISVFQLGDAIFSELYIFKAHAHPVLALAVHSVDSTFLSVSADSKIIKHQLTPTTEIMQSIDTKHAGINSVKIRADQKIFATGSWDGRVRIYLYKSIKLLAAFPAGRQDKIGGLAFGFYSPTLSHSQTVQTQTTTIKEKLVQKIQDSHWLAVGGKDGRIGLWNIY